MHERSSKKHAGEHGRASHDFHASPGLIRNRYFYGMLLEAQDMSVEQAFHLGNVRRHLAEMHGHGTVCGLRVDEAEGCEAVVLRPGVAADCLGREIRVEREVRVDLHEAVEYALRLREEHLGPAEEPGKLKRAQERCGPESVEVYLSLCYEEAAERLVQSLASPEAACSPVCEPSRVRHGFRVAISVEPPEPCARKLDGFIDELFECERERLSTLLCSWITGDGWASALDPCADAHGCVGLARVRVVPGGSVVDIDNCAIRPLVLSTAMLSELVQYALHRVRRGR